MSQETNNHFFYNYQMAKMSWTVNDEHWQEVLNSPKPPVTATRKVKVKSIVRDMTKEESKLL